MIHEPLIEQRVHWGMTVRLVQTKYQPAKIDPEQDPKSEIDWAEENSGGRRISYDTWQFKNLQEAEEFVIMFRLRFGSRI